ncbi:ABC transporter substrate-binding protein [Mumia zhuanghuii]|uniref:ABC transporter substrate-binding protein n=2 Tax=Mumia TaxID=1546255 RepID=A0ABW1QQT2_9ACTN|nr:MULTISPECIES: ABC transporter substrate-binding protein [Mumia]KAA1424429.1 ABC transporter substrate-binding protein [Mumia zhuanghuii]
MRPVLPALLCSSALVLTACGGASDTSDAAVGTADGYPLTIDNCGREVVIDAPPQRVVSLNQGSTEILLSLGLADRMVGTATWTDPVRENLAADNESVPRLSDQAPSFERVLEAEPDLVTASFESTLGEGGVATRDDLEKLGVPSYLSPAECEKDNEGDDDGSRATPLAIDTVYGEVTDLATVFGVPDKGADLVAELRASLTQAQDVVDAEGVSAMFWFANSESPYLAGCCGAPGIISEALGLENVFDDTTAEWPQINWETVADRDPDVLVIGDLTRKSQTAETAAAKIAFLEQHPVTREMTAVKNKRYIAVTGAEMNPSIRTIDGVRNVAEGIRDLGLGR